jgi:hypothetical protein
MAQINAPLTAIIPFGRLLYAGTRGRHRISAFRFEKLFHGLAVRRHVNSRCRQLKRIRVAQNSSRTLLLTAAAIRMKYVSVSCIFKWSWLD